jgi:hypothetical protein
MAAPTADTADELTKATKSYAKQLCKQVAAPVQVWRVKTRPLPGGAKEILTPAIGIGAAVAGWLVGVPVAVGVTAVGAGAMLVRKGRRRTATEKWALRFPSLLLPAS